MCSLFVGNLCEHRTYHRFSDSLHCDKQAINSFKLPIHQCIFTINNIFFQNLDYILSLQRITYIQFLKILVLVWASIK